MSFNLDKLLPAILDGIAIAKKIGAGKSGKERLQIALDSSDAIIDTIELGADKDLFNDPAVAQLKANFVTAAYELKKGLEALKNAKGTGGSPQ